MTTQVYQLGGNGQVTGFPLPIRSPRNPVSGVDIISPDGSPYVVGQGWQNTTTGNLFQFVGSGIWESVLNPAAHYPITPYVVGSSSTAGYTTIQSAINAAQAAGGGVIYIQPGAYTENLTLYDKVDLYATPAVSQNQGATVSITGTHTPPASGHVGFNSICFINATSVFSSAAAGTAHLVWLNCESAVSSGYFISLPNWTGIIEIYDFNPSTAGAPGAVNDGGIYNTGGATILAFSAGIGANGTSPMTISGNFIGDTLNIGAPVSMVTGASFALQWCAFLYPVTFANNSTGSIQFSSFVGGSNAAITMSSSATVSLLQNSFSSSHNPSIAGSGPGTLTLGDIIFLGNSTVANTLTLAYTPSLLGTTTLQGNLAFGTAGNKITTPIATNTTTAGANAFGTVTLTGGTATVSTTAVTANSVISLTRQSVGTTGANPLGFLTIGTITPATSFVINAWSTTNATSLAATDVSVILWEITN